MKPLHFALLGDPVGHSRSPAMHKAAFAALGLPHTYEAIQVQASELAGYIQKLRDGTFAGYNVTLPHKHAILEERVVDDVLDLAELAGAANTLFLSEGRVGATTTDVPAIAAEIALLTPAYVRSALVLGTGGAARSAIVALARGFGANEIVVRGRTRPAEFADEMQARLGNETRIIGEPLIATERDSVFDCIVQASSAGMTGVGSGEHVMNPVAWDRVRAVVLDVVYEPRVTPFLAAARAHGLKHAGGLGMLARQGALSLERWLGHPAPFDAMLAALTS